MEKDLTNQMSSREDVTMEEIKNESLFAAFDFSVDEVEDVLEEAKKSKAKSKSICMCGHADGFHDSSASGEQYCTANKQNCKCVKKDLVLVAQDTRIFLRKTTGPGPQHALAQGIRDAEKAGQMLQWIGTPKCEPCGSTVDLSPCPVSERGVILYEDKGINKWLCAECRRVR